MSPFFGRFQDNHVDEKMKKELNINEKDKEDHEVWRTFKELLSSRTLVLRGAVLFVLWATNAFVFYGLSLNATSLSGNKYINFILVCLVEIPGYTLSWIAMNKIGRRWAIAGSYLLCSFSCTAGGFVPPGNFDFSFHTFAFAESLIQFPVSGHKYRMDVGGGIAVFNWKTWNNFGFCHIVCSHSRNDADSD